MDVCFDLFGEPVPANHGERGRPEHVATSENRNRIMILLAAGWTNARIAAALGISQPTLRKHYSSELALRSKAMDRVKATQFALLFRQMQDGSVPAHKEFDRLMQREHMLIADARMRKAPKAEKPGKKAEANAAAQTAHRGSEWEDVLPNLETAH